MPGAIDHAGAAEDGAGTGCRFAAEGDKAAAEGEAVVARVGRAVGVVVEDDVAVDPVRIGTGSDDGLSVGA